MRLVDSATSDALSATLQVPRDFLELRARNRSSGAAITDFMWSGGTDVSAAILDPFTGSERTQLWHGVGHLVGVGPVMRVSNLTITRTIIRLSEVSQRVNDLIRAYDPKYGTVILYRAFISPETRKFVSPGRARFVGQIDNIVFTDPAEGDTGGVEVTCKSRMQDLTRGNPATRSDSYQRLRKSNDTFRKFVAAIGQRKFSWGEK